MAAFLTARQVGERWGCSPKTVKRLAERGELAAMKLGADWRIGTAAVEAYEQRHTTSAESVQAAPTAGVQKQEVGATTAVGGFTLPDDYEPCFPDLWPGHEPRTKRAALTGK